MAGNFPVQDELATIWRAVGFGGPGSGSGSGDFLPLPFPLDAGSTAVFFGVGVFFFAIFDTLMLGGCMAKYF